MREVVAIVEEVDALRERIDAFRPFTPEAEEQIQKWFLPRFIWCSTAIGERNALSGPEVAAFLERQVVSGGHTLDRFLAVARHKNALELVQERAKVGGAVLDVPFIQLVHRRLVQGGETGADVRPGLWKRNESPPTRRRGHTFTYAIPTEVEPLMKKLVHGFASKLKKSHPLDAITWFYFHLNALHPFERQNGKVARLLANCALFNHGYPPLIIVPDEVGQYLDALTTCDATVAPSERSFLSERYDLSALLEFFCTHLKRTGERYLQILKGEKLSTAVFSRQALQDQEQMLSRFLTRKNLSWRVRATFEIRALHKRVEEMLRNLTLEGPLYNIHFKRASVIPSHDASPLLGTSLPSGDAGLIGIVEMVMAGEPTTKGLRFPDNRNLVMAVSAASYGMQLIYAWDDPHSDPVVHHGPPRAPEWPTSTLDEIITIAVDKRRRIFESELRALNGSLSERYRKARERLQAESGVYDRTAKAAEEKRARQARAYATSRMKRPAKVVPPREKRSATNLDGLRPSEPPLGF